VSLKAMAEACTSTCVRDERSAMGALEVADKLDANSLLEMAARTLRYNLPALLASPSWASGFARLPRSILRRLEQTIATPSLPTACSVPGDDLSAAFPALAYHSPPPAESPPRAPTKKDECEGKGEKGELCSTARVSSEGGKNEPAQSQRGFSLSEQKKEAEPEGEASKSRRKKSKKSKGKGKKPEEPANPPPPPGVPPSQARSQSNLSNLLRGESEEMPTTETQSHQQQSMPWATQGQAIPDLASIQQEQLIQSATSSPPSYALAASSSSTPKAVPSANSRKFTSRRTKSQSVPLSPPGGSATAWGGAGNNQGGSPAPSLKDIQEEQERQEERCVRVKSRAWGMPESPSDASASPDRAQVEERALQELSRRFGSARIRKSSSSPTS